MTPTHAQTAAPAPPAPGRAARALRMIFRGVTAQDVAEHLARQRRTDQARRARQQLRARR